MAENKMAEVAKLFGKELSEEFKVRAFSYIIKTKFTEFGLEEHFFLRQSGCLMVSCYKCYSQVRR